MLLVPPKRLFHVPSMSTVFYENVVDVKEKGYVAVSHVWGDQQMYSVDELGVVGGVDWKIPLSHPNKICRLIDAMNQFEMEYCWFDVLCMPQDRQNEINLEIPMMGDYYNGADMTLVLSDESYAMSEDFIKWSDMVSSIMDLGRELSLEEESWIAKERNLLDVSKDKWFTRVWTLQEAVLSQKVILVEVNGCCINLSDVIVRLRHMSSMNLVYAHILFKDSASSILSLANIKHELRDGTLDLARVLNVNGTRDCYKIHDRFYGIFGILGYKDFVVDYDMSIDDLNKLVVQYSYSKGDISWLAVGGKAASNFVQPMYQPYPYLGFSWREDTSGVCDIVLDDSTLHMKAMEFATVVRTERHVATQSLEEDMMWAIHAFTDWGFSGEDIFHAMMGYIGMPNDYMEIGIKFLDAISRGVDMTDIGEELLTQDDNSHKYLGDMMTKMEINSRIYKLPAAIVEVNISQINQKCILIVSGDANIGDIIALPRMHDSAKRNLGIVVSKSFRRKGVCFVPQIRIPDSLKDIWFVPRKFPL